MSFSLFSKRPTHLQFSACVLALLLTTLSACSTLEGDKIDYRSAEKGRSLEVPPDLTALPRNTQYQVQRDGGVSAKASGNAANDKVVSAGTSTAGDVKVMRSGNKSWLIVQRPSDRIWPVLDEFWIENGFTISRSDRTLGIVETGWAENRAKLPQDFIRETVGRIFDSFYSTGERDKFRTRIESLDDGKSTAIYITHRGMVEKVSESLEGSVWEPRDSDPELEAEFQRRLMLRLGLSEAQSKQLQAKETTTDTIKFHKDATPIKILINENFNSAWRRVGISLDRAGFTVTDKDRSKGTYYIRTGSKKAEEKPGLFGRIFGSDSGKNSSSTTTYLVKVDAMNADTTRVTVQNENGQNAEQSVAEKTLQVIYDSF